MPYSRWDSPAAMTSNDRALPRRSLRLGAVFSILLASGLLTACGEAPPPGPSDPTNAPGMDAGEQGKIEKSKTKIAEANRALNAKGYEKARKLLKEAASLEVESHRFEITEMLEKVDKRHAKLFANEALEKLANKDCSGAFKDLAAQIDAMKSEVFTREIRKLVASPAVSCLQAAVDEATVAAKYADARKLVEAPDTITVLGPQAHKKVATELDGTIEEALKGIVADDIKAKRWSVAMDKFDATVKKGDADEAKSKAILDSIRAAVAPEIQALAARGIGSRDASAILKQVDALIKVVRWEVLSGEAAELAKDKALPDPPKKTREALAVWVESQRAGMKPIKKAEKRWTHGKIRLLPGSAIEGESKRDLQPSTEVWILGQTKEKALITEQAPAEGATLQAQLEKASGWVPLDRLAKEATIDWVPPDDQLKGARVWGPLRAPDPLYELGIVSEVKGADVSVKRVTDDVEVKVARKSLRGGRVVVGNVVLAFCKAKDEKAKIEEIMPGGRAVKLKCENGGELKEETLAGIRSRPDLLPPSK
jgi:hypothetical protein